MTSHRSRGIVRVACSVAAIAVLAVVSACSSDQASSDGDAGGDGGDSVVLVTYDSFALPEDAAAAFEEQTGATIEVVAAGDSGTMLTSALLSAGAPEGDVIFGIDNTLATRALSEDLLEPFEPEGLAEVPEQYLLEGDAGERLVPIDTGDVCMNMDQQWFADAGVALPTTMEQLTEPTYRDLTVIESPVTSSPGLAFMIGTIARYGEDGWLDYWQRLEDNGVRVRPSWDDAYYSDYTVSGGDRPIVLSYASSPPVELVFSEGAFTEPPSTVMLDSCASQVEYAGVLRGAEHPELARELVEFMLSPEWQQALPMSNFVFPVLDVELPEEFATWAQRAEQPLALDPATVDAQRETWIEAWREQME
jgi:thiamine transport system substrate-binding protein